MTKKTSYMIGHPVEFYDDIHRIGHFINFERLKNLKQTYDAETEEDSEAYNDEFMG